VGKVNGMKKKNGRERKKSAVDFPQRIFMMPKG